MVCEPLIPGIMGDSGNAIQWTPDCFKMSFYFLVPLPPKRKMKKLMTLYNRYRFSIEIIPHLAGS